MSTKGFLIPGEGFFLTIADFPFLNPFPSTEVYQWVVGKVKPK
jgi:hypothetical protein